MYALYIIAFLAVFGGLGLLIGLGWFIVPVLILFGLPFLYVLWVILWLMQERRDHEESP